MENLFWNIAYGTLAIGFLALVTSPFWVSWYRKHEFEMKQAREQAAKITHETLIDYAETRGIGKFKPAQGGWF